MESLGFENLDVYRVAAQLSDEVREAVRGWDKVDLWSSGIQAIRAADSIGANIAEAFGRGTRPDQIRFLFMARASANELQHWIARAEARSLPYPPGAGDRANRIGQMLNGLLQSLPRNART